MSTGVCLDCQGSEHPVVGRGLCQRCYRRHHHQGTLDRYPRVERTPSGLVAPKVAQAAGVTYRQLDYWLRRGYLTGTPVTTGSGHPRTLTGEQILTARRMGVLVGLGIPAGLAATALHNDGLLSPGIRLVFADPQPSGDGDPWDQALIDMGYINCAAHGEWHRPPACPIDEDGHPNPTWTDPEDGA